MGELGASCFYTHSNNARDLSKTEWDEERVGKVCTEAATLANYKTAIQKLCYVTKSCTIEQKKILKQIGTKLELFDKEANDYATSSLNP